MCFIMLNSWIGLATQNGQKKIFLKNPPKMPEPPSSWTLKTAEVQEVACVLQLS